MKNFLKWVSAKSNDFHVSISTNGCIGLSIFLNHWKTLEFNDVQGELDDQTGEMEMIEEEPVDYDSETVDIGMDVFRKCFKY